MQLILDIGLRKAKYNGRQIVERIDATSLSDDAILLFL